MEQSRKNAHEYPRPSTEYIYARRLVEMRQGPKARNVLEDMLATADMAPPEDEVWIRRGRWLLRFIKWFGMGRPK